jgi:hypothetical protein
VDSVIIATIILSVILMVIAVTLLTFKRTARARPPVEYPPEFVIISKSRPKFNGGVIKPVPTRIDTTSFQGTIQKNYTARCLLTGMEVRSCTCEKHRGKM